ncbi:MAG: hypothetical protein ACYCQJ_12900 [Nitrososphaerales archaeon]
MTFKVYVFEHKVKSLPFKFTTGEAKPLKVLSDYLNGIYEAKELKGFTLKHITSSISDENIIYTLVFEN